MEVFDAPLLDIVFIAFFCLISIQSRQYFERESMLFLDLLLVYEK